jgi:hypothetical protein
MIVHASLDAGSGVIIANALADRPDICNARLILPFTTLWLYIGLFDRVVRRRVILTVAGKESGTLRTRQMAPR